MILATSWLTAENVLTASNVVLAAAATWAIFSSKQVARAAVDQGQVSTGEPTEH